ncbi:MAG TPA: alpha/beta-hydrolase family protein [Candidatus Saccharimonadales bacterium]|nr:alpha/beta-hydrolase family protein [Candidatus Saccharimonadales bacterium]
MKIFARYLVWLRQHFNYFGLLFALVFFCLSLTPSLLPRVWLLQGLVSGVSVAVGYGLGFLASLIVRKLVRKEPKKLTKARAWQGLVVAGVLFIFFFSYLSFNWQQETRRLVGTAPADGFHLLGVILTTLLIALLLTLIFRLVRLTFLFLKKQLLRFISPALAYTIAAVLVSFLVIFVVNGVLFENFVKVANQAFSVNNDTTTPGVEQPTTPFVSGSKDSLISWDSLGLKGRDFVSRTTPLPELEKFNNTKPLQPIRLYAGIESADSAQGRADLVIKEIERTHAMDRKVLLVVTSTGSGWVNNNPVSSLEYMYNGDTATVATQYSFLPSWLSFLVDADKAKEAGRAMINSVYEVWSKLPKESRPKLLVYGESLGSFGSESAFSGIADMQSRTDGILLVGPVFSNQLHREFTADREQGSLERLPVYDSGAAVRFAAEPTDLDHPMTTWTNPRIVYLQHATDPIVWWSGRLLFRKPDWLKEPRGTDVLPNMTWYPVVTFAQVSVDLMFSTGYPGHGHAYGSKATDVWAKIVPPANWTTEKTSQLKKIIGEEQ